MFDVLVKITQSPRLMHVKRIVIGLGIWSACWAAGAAESGKETREITLSDAVHLAILNNYDVRIQRFNPDIFQYNLGISYAVYEPAFTFSAERSFNSQPGGTDPQGLPLPSTEIESDSLSGAVGPGLSGYAPTGLRYQLSAFVARREFESDQFPTREEFRSGLTVSLEQPLLRDFWIDQPRAEIQLSKKNVEISGAVFREQLMQTVAAVEQAYYNLIFARENVKVQQAALDLAERLFLENRKRVEVGTMAPLEEKQAESQVATSRAQLLEGQRNLEAQENTLKDLITDDYLKWHAINLMPAENLVIIPPEMLDLAESWREGLTKRPDLEQLRLDLEKRDITLRFQKNQLFPALDLVGTYGRNGLNESYGSALDDLVAGDDPRYSAGVVLSIPLGNRAARNRYKAGKAEKEQAVLQYKKLEQSVMVEIDNAIRLVETSFERVQATREAREFAEAALQAEQRRLESGKSTSFFVLQFQRDLTAARFEEIQALAQYNNALAQLALRKGTTLERHGIETDAKEP